MSSEEHAGSDSTAGTGMSGAVETAAAETAAAHTDPEAAAVIEEGVPPCDEPTADAAQPAQLVLEPASEAPEPAPAAPEPAPQACPAVPPAGLESTVPAGPRTAIFEELLTMGREYMSDFDSYELLTEDPSRGLQARRCNFPGTALPVTLVRLRADGFTMDHVRAHPRANRQTAAMSAH